MSKARQLLTPVILTRNEEVNIGRTLAGLQWAARIVVLDSFSTDRTAEIARSFSNVDFRQRRFDQHATQWRHAILECGVATEYALALDADMVVTKECLEEFDRSFDQTKYAGAIVPFSYLISGRELTGSLYPAQLRIFRLDAVDIAQEGHTQVFRVRAPIFHLRSPVHHDDRKPMEDWVASQVRYSALEVTANAVTEPGSFKMRLRRSGLMPVIAGLVAYSRAGGPFGGRLSLQYAYQRVVFESLLAMRILASKDSPNAR